MQQVRYVSDYWITFFFAYNSVVNTWDNVWTIIVQYDDTLS